MLSEAIEAATGIIGSYPNGGANAGDSYIGALASTLMAYPRQVAARCADFPRVLGAPFQGVAATRKFLPTPADIVVWCERDAALLYRRADAERAAVVQAQERVAIQKFDAEVRPGRLSIEELKDRYGDWANGWERPGEREAVLRAEARTELIRQVGRPAFDALPERAGVR